MRLLAARTPQMVGSAAPRPVARPPRAVGSALPPRLAARSPLASCAETHPSSLRRSSYPPSPPKAALGKLTFGLQLLGLGLTLGGQHIFPDPASQPAWLKPLQENKLQSAMFIWFMGNMIQQNLATTGAFEVFFDGQPIFSKLETGHAPNLAVVAQNVLNAYNARLEALGA